MLVLFPRSVNSPLRHLRHTDPSAPPQASGLGHLLSRILPFEDLGARSGVLLDLAKILSLVYRNR